MRRSPEQIENQIQSVVKDASLATVNSQKTDNPIDASGIVEICEGLMEWQAIRVGNAEPAILRFYELVKERHY